MKTEYTALKQAWYCERCGLDTVFVHDAIAHAGMVKEGVLLQHRRNSPQCTANDLGPIRFRDSRPAED